MSTFGRTFAIEKITDQVLQENPWFKDLLSGWRPAGDALQPNMAEAPTLVASGQTPEEDPSGLRLAIREGYLNFYWGGSRSQKSDFGENGLQAKIHNKYVYGEKGNGQRYVTLTSAGLRDEETGKRDYEGLADLQGWIANANGTSTLAKRSGSST